MSRPGARCERFATATGSPAWLSPPAAGPWPWRADDNEAIGRAAITGYAANVKSFSFYKCRYQYTRAQARSTEDGIRGNWLNARFFDSRLIVDGDKDLYEGFAPPPDLRNARPIEGKGAKGAFRVVSPGKSDRYLSDGTREMNYNPTLESINLFSADKNYHGISPTPLAMGFVGHRNRGGPDELLQQGDKYAFSCDGLQEIDGRPVVTVRFRHQKPLHTADGAIELTTVFSFDPGRGHLPIRMATLCNAQPKTQVFVIDVRECSKQRWFPERSIVVDTPDRAGDLYDVVEIKLLELDADKRPAPDEFSFTIPAGTSVHEYDPSSGKYFRLKRDEKISVDDIPKLFEMVRKAADRPLMDTAVPHADPYRWIRSVGIGAGLALCLAGLLFLSRRWPRRRAA